MAHVVIAVLILYISAFGYRRFCKAELSAKRSLWVLGIGIVSLAALLVIMRGGLQTIPINVSAAYHSNDQINNHTAINPHWNLFHSILKSMKSNDPYDLLSDEEVQMILEMDNPLQIEALNITPDPNIVIIVWESFTAKITSDYGDSTTVPLFNKMKEEGIYFNNFYANGTRSDKGLVSIFSGYYPQALKSIMKETEKARTLPSLFRELKTVDYKSSFYYGGDTNFGNMNSYFLEGGIDEIIDGSSFVEENKNTKWGAFDHVVLEKFLQDINDEKEKFCKVLFTITSHEPYEIPMEYKFGKDNEENSFKSAHHYTDKSIGSFIASAKKQDWWNNTLVVIMADHGHPLPRIEKHPNDTDRYRIPMLWTGGAIQHKDTIVETIASQVDFVETLLSQLDITRKASFPFSENIFNHYNKGKAHYIYTNGFGTISPEGSVLFDFDQNKKVHSTGSATDVLNLEKLGKAISQNAYNDYLSR